MMKRELFVREHTLDCLGMKVHVIRVNDEQRGGCYRQISSLEGFINRTSERWYAYYYKSRYHLFNSQVHFKRMYKDDVKLRTVQYCNTKKLIGQKEADKLFSLPEYVFHDSVWSFFESIGYDHRNKKVSHLDKFILREVK